MRATYRLPPQLLLRQLCLLAAICGIFASRYFVPGLTALFLLLLHQQGRILRRSSLSAIWVLVALGLCFGGGLFYAQWRAPVAPAFPLWLREAVTPNPHLARLEAEQGRHFSSTGRGRAQTPPTLMQVADNALEDTTAIAADSIFRTGLRLRATVMESQGQPDRNLRLTLHQLRQLDDEGKGATFDGRLTFTWHRPLTPEAPKPAPPGMFFASADASSAQELYRRPVAGDEIELRLRPRVIQSLQNPGLWETEQYWADNGVWARAWAMQAGPELDLAPGPQNFIHSAASWRERLRLQSALALPRADGNIVNGAELIPALLFGDKYLLDSSDTELFARSTLAHSLALSGLHLGYAAALGYCLVLLLYRLFPALALHLPRQKAAVAASLLPATLYLWLGGCPPSLLRSYLMLLFAGGLLYYGKPQLLGDALIWAISLILLLNPLAAFDLRLQLSALCIAALALLLPCAGLLRPKALGLPLIRPCGSSFGPPGAAPYPQGRLKKLLRYFLILLFTSAVIQVALAPLLVRSFGLAGLAVPLNLLWLPVLGLVVMPCAFLGLLASALGVEAAAALLFHCAALPCGWLMQALRHLDEAGLLPAILPLRPHWLTMLAYWFLLALLPAALTRLAQSHAPKLQSAPGANNPTPHPAQQPRKLLLAQTLCGLLLLAAPLVGQQYHNSREALRLRLLDVGHGQSVLLEWQGGKRLLLDGGGGSSTRFDIGKEVIAATLAQNRRPSLDFMLASHLDADHAQGLLFPLQHIPVAYYADNGPTPDKGVAQSLTEELQRKNIARNTLLAGDTLALGPGLQLEILHPAAPGGGNNYSMVTRLVWQGEGLALFCGDVEKSGQTAILKRLTEQNRLRSLSAHILVLPHHGSKNALLPEFYAAVNPELALVSTAYGNTWHFPAAEVKNSLRQMHIPLLNTARTGQIEVQWLSPHQPPSISTARTGPLQ